MNTEKGILIFATDISYYGRMAYNLAVSIKAVEDIPVAVVTKGGGLSHLNDTRKAIFDSIIELDGEAFGTSVKLNAYKYSPFERTLLIDADNVWLPNKKPSELFKQLEGVSFTAITEGKHDDLNPAYIRWGNVEQIMDVYELDEMYQWRTEVVYFEKGEQAEVLYDTALELLREEPRVDVQHLGGFIPDEYIINIAASMVGIQPHKYKWQPAYWYFLHKGKFVAANILDEYYILSTGGNMLNRNVEVLYNNVVQAAHNKLRLQNIFKLRSKRSAITQRRQY